VFDVKGQAAQLLSFALPAEPFPQTQGPELASQFPIQVHDHILMAISFAWVADSPLFRWVGRPQHFSWLRCQYSL